MTRTAKPKPRRPLALLVDGIPEDDTLTAGLLAVDPHGVDPDFATELIALALSVRGPHVAVAITRLGAPETLRRFVAGVEVTR